MSSEDESCSNTESQNISYQVAIENIEFCKSWQKEIKRGHRIGLYKIIKDVGKGNFSQVKLGSHSLTKDKVALKIIDKSKLNAKTQRFVAREISSMEKMEHPYILYLFQVIRTPSRIFIVSEFAEGGDLYTKLTDDGRLPENVCRTIFGQMVSAVDYMHRLGIIHRDLKAENILFSGGSAKLGDFGFSTQVELGSLLSTYCGSPPYAAPELFKDDSYVGESVDVWALGVLLYFMSTALLPFQADTIKKLKALILEGNFIIPAFVTVRCARLLRNILLPNPAERLKVDEILADSWVRSALAGAIPGRDESSKSHISEDKLEEEVLSELREYQISEDQLKEELERSDSSSHLAAVYRIVKHRKRFGVGRWKGGELDSVAVEKKTKFFSKICIIL